MADTRGLQLDELVFVTVVGGIARMVRMAQLYRHGHRSAKHVYPTDAHQPHRPTGTGRGPQSITGLYTLFTKCFVYQRGATSQTILRN